MIGANETVDVAMPFGRHRNRPLTEVPRQYLVWASGFGNLEPHLADAIRAELARRGLGFGKLKDVPLPDVPTAYLRWLSTLQGLLPPWPDLVNDELRNRKREK